MSFYEIELTDGEELTVGKLGGYFTNAAVFLPEVSSKLYVTIGPKVSLCIPAGFNAAAFDNLYIIPNSILTVQAPDATVESPVKLVVNVWLGRWRQ